MSSALPAYSIWVSNIQENSAVRMRLFCFPYAGGGASFYRNWSNYLPHSIHVCPLHLPAREKRYFEKPFLRMSDLLDNLEVALENFLDVPFAFFGHSLGSLIAFELTRRLIAKKHFRPQHLFVSANRAPQCPLADPIHKLSQDAFVNELKYYGGMPEEILKNPELLEVILPALRADFELLETYIYQNGEPLSVPISVSGGLDDPKVSRAYLEAWDQQTLMKFQLRLHSGGHFYLANHLPEVLKMIVYDLSQKSNGI